MCPSGSWIRTNAKQLLSQGYEPCMLPLHYPAINSTSSWIQTNDPRIHTTLCYHSQITTTSWREVQYLTNISGTPLVYRPNSASWVVCCVLD